MSVIPIVFKKGEKRITVATTPEQYENLAGIYGNAVLIREFDATQFDASDDTKRNSNLTYDLRVGGRYRHHSHEQPTDLMEIGDSSFVLRPKEAVIIQTEEYVHFPKSIFGHIVPKVSLLHKGISNTSSKVDPGYEGPLYITVFNLGKETVQLRRGDPFCCLYLLQVSNVDDAHQYNKPVKITLSRRVDYGRLEAIKQLLRRHDLTLLLLSIVLSILSVITVIVILLL